MKRFFDKVIKTDTCWNWQGDPNRNVYGAFKLNGKNIGSHRFSWILHFGEIPNGLFVCHKCDNRRCVNPEHLFLGTAKDNMIDCVNKKRNFRNVNNQSMKGRYPTSTKIPLERAIEIKKLVLNRGNKKLIDLAKELNVGYDYIRCISCGKILKNY